MGKQAFVIAGSRAVLVANDSADFRYRAAAHYLPVGVQLPIRSHDHAETQFMIDDGIVEFMIGGAAGIVFSGDFVRVPAGVPYAYRNVGEVTARILVRSVNPAPTRQATQITFAA